MSFSWPNQSLSHEDTRKALRQNILEQIHLAKSGHPGGALSLVEILCAIFENNFHWSPSEPESPTRDRFVLSKGHGVPAYYAVLSKLGFFNPAETKNLRQYSHYLQGHPDRLRFSLMEASTGSLGQGVSVALGLALGLWHDFQKGHLNRLPRVYCVLGDGESQEGQVWECLMACGKFKVPNLCFVLDFNKGQIDGPTEEVMNLEPMTDKVKAFGLKVDRMDGHCVESLNSYFSAWNPAEEKQSRFLIADTVKGKGVSFMEHVIKWHGVAPTEEELKQATGEIYANADGPWPNGSIL